MIYISKKTLYLFLFVAIHIFLTQSPVLSSVPKRITFEKKGQEQTKYNLTFVYKVQEGNTIYSILKYFQPNKQDLSDLITKVNELNPHIENINKIYPGQKIRLPQKFKKNSTSKTSFKNKYHKLAGNYKTKKYTVKSGDYIVKILKEKSNLSEELIFDEYLQLFKQLNPNISNIQKLKVGQEITLPSPVKKDTQDEPSKTSSKDGLDKTNKKTVNSTDTKEEQTFPSRDISNPNKYMALTMLKKMGFKFSENKKVFLPYNSTKWRALDSIKNPLAVAPWGEKYIFLSKPDFPNSLLKQIRKEELTICNTGDSWNIKELFANIEKKSNKKLIFWNPDQTLILNNNNHILEIQGDYVFVLNMSSKSYFLFTKNETPGIKISSILSGYLAKQNINIYSLQEKDKKTTKLRKNYPSSDKLYVPIRSRSEILSAIQKDKFKNKIELGKEMELGQNFLNSLQKKELAQKKNLRLVYFKNSNTRMVLNIQATKLLKTDKNVLLLPPAHKENRYLLTLLNLQGYPAYVLSK